MPPGRNNPCPCGSGRKYKKCCALKDAISTGAHAETNFHRTDIYASTESVQSEKTADGGADVHQTNQAADNDSHAHDSPQPNSELIKLLDMASARETIEKLGMDDLRYLNKLIVERINFLMHCKSKVKLMAYHPGNRVRFTSASGEEKKGTVIRVNQKTVSIAVDGEPGWWKVAPDFLTRINSPHP